MGIIDNLFILPCLQEKRVGTGFTEPEQIGSLFNNNGDVIKEVGSDFYNELWSGLSNSYGEASATFSRDARESLMPVFMSPEIFGEQGFKDCKSTPTLEKWKIYGKFLLEQTRNSTNDIVSLIVSHHNRMRGIPGDKYSEQLSSSGGGFLKKSTVSFKNFFNLNDSTAPLLPLKNNNCGAYANNFCLRINYNKFTNKIEYKVVFPGFPDKGSLAPKCGGKSVRVKKIQNGGEYEYCCQAYIDNIDTGIIDRALTEVFNGCNKNVTIYLIRHGNSLHNKPVKIKKVDSSLTFLGMYQAYLLGTYLKTQENYKDDFNGDKDIVLCSSFLSRAQLTLLCIIESIYGESLLPDKIKADYNLLKKIAKHRFLAIDKNSRSFIGYPPIENEEDFSMFESFLNGRSLNKMIGGNKRYLKKSAKSKKKSKKKNLEKKRINPKKINYSENQQSKKDVLQ